MSTSVLPAIQTQMNFYGYSILLVIGNIGNIFIFILFYRQKHNACSIYLMNSSIANILYLTISSFFKIASYPSNDGTLRAIVICKFTTFIPFFLGQVTKTLLIFACIDRYMITSNRVSLRAFSTPKRAKYFTFAIYIFWAVVASPNLVWTIVLNGQCALVDNYAIFYAFYSFFIVGLVPFVTLCVFTYLTYRNMKQLRNRIQPVAQSTTNTNNRIKRRDRDLLVLVMAEVLVYIITTSPFVLVLLERMISQFVVATKTLQFVQAEVFVLNIAFLLILGFSAVPFYTYISVSASFRQDVKQLIVDGYRKIRNATVHSNISGVVRTIGQRDTRV